MRIELEPRVYLLGEPIPIRILYENPSDAAIVISDPRDSMEVEMILVDLISGETLGHTMGQIATTEFGEDQYALEVPPPKEVQIDARSELEFTSDPDERLYLYPSRFECYLAEESGEQSNHVEIEIEFAKGSVELLMAKAADTELDYGRREWAIAWLGGLYPEFSPTLVPDDASAEEKSSNAATNIPFFEALEGWWRNNESDPEVEERIRRMSEKGLE